MGILQLQLARWRKISGEGLGWGAGFGVVQVVFVIVFEFWLIKLFFISGFGVLVCVEGVYIYLYAG